MKKVLPAILAIGAIACGCTNSSHLTTKDAPPGQLLVEVSPSGRALDGVRVYVDGRLVGNYVPDGMALRLPTGTHTIRVEIPRLYEEYRRPDGSGSGRTFTAKGEERIVVLGGEHQQRIVFNESNLRKRDI